MKKIGKKRIGFLDGKGEVKCVFLEKVVLGFLVKGKVRGVGYCFICKGMYC